MKNNFCIILIVIASLSSTVFFSCNASPVTYSETSPETNNSETKDDTSNSLQVSEMFVQQNDGSYLFQTNDKKYLSSKGFSLWCITNKMQNDTPFSEIKFTATKMQGNKNYGYGIVFNENTNLNGDNSFICVLIRATGEYAVGKVVNGVYADIVYWKRNPYIRTGIGNANVISITKNTVYNKYQIVFNNCYDSNVEFIDQDSYSFSNGNYGFISIIAPNENFDLSSVKVNFKYDILQTTK